MDFKLYIIIALVLGGSVISLKNHSLKTELEQNKAHLQMALRANENLQNTLKNLQDLRAKELKAIAQAHNEEKEVKERVNEVTKYIYTSKENNLTKLFNEMAGRLFDER